MTAFYYSGFKKNAARRKVENAFVFRIDGKDGQGRNASFDFLILTNEFTWVKGSANQVAYREQAIPEAEAVERIVTPSVRETLLHSPDLIADRRGIERRR